jgi:hypothetical protein
MGLFKSKPKISIETCAKEFYDANIFKAVVAGSDIWSIFLDRAFDSIETADSSFSLVNRETFRKEMIALRIELFALALNQHYKEKNPNYMLSTFTRKYLIENKSLEIWQIMNEYNQIIAYSTTRKADMKPLSVQQITWLNLQREKLFDEYCAKNELEGKTKPQKEQLECVARVLNRIGADTKREGRVLLTLLMSRLANRLDCSENLTIGAIQSLSSLISGLYSGATIYLDDINIEY